MKPPELVARAINNSSRAGESVLDLFLGSGTTIVACEQTGRIGYGMEIEPKYVAVTLQRLADIDLEPRRVETSVLMEEPA
jgi:DNA modification methylase